MSSSSRGKGRPRTTRRIYLVNPRGPESFWNMQGTVRAAGARSLMPSAALATLASLTPPDLGLELAHCDESLSAVRLDLPCDLVALTGYSVHARRIAEISRAFRRRGVPVALGGAWATMAPDEARDHADHLFVGEAEHTWPAFLREWLQGQARPLYEQTGHVDLADSPPPDWSLVNGRDYLYLTVQTSRGCPHRCDFCNAVRFVGARHRRKTPDQVLQEVEGARRAGAEIVFFSEDNFYVSRGHTHELLERLIRYNTSLRHPMQFSCQASIRITDDEQTLRLMADARFSVVFLGIESLRRECLEEVNKGRLYCPDLRERLMRLCGHGLLPFVGLMVGFDHDDERTFDEIEQFLEETACPIASITLLNAPEGTVLHERMSARGRIDERFSGLWHHSTNIVPLGWSIDELLARHKALFRRLYEPERFERRALRYLANVRHFSQLYAGRRRKAANWIKLLHVFGHYTTRVPPEVRGVFLRTLARAAALDPRLIRRAITLLTQYCHYYTWVNRPSW